MLRIGMFIADRYEILAHIGSGGMSEVYKAKCHKLNRFVAIKVLKNEFAQNPDFVAKFRIEAQSAAILSHPNIVSIFDVGDENDIHYIVMELIEGITLKDYISNKGKLDIRESIGITIQVAQGLAAAHEQHIIHRDIKPQNIIISKDAKVKVMDFGIARATSGDTINSSANMGSVHYISPEQARGGYCDERSDIYSLGVTLYEMLAGQVPFDGENTVAIALAHIQNEFPSLRELDETIPVSLEKIIFKCTMKKAERRYSSVMELIGDLRKALISPDEDFVKVVSPINNNPTKMISPEDVESIRNGSKAILVEDASVLAAGEGQEEVSDEEIVVEPEDADGEQNENDEEDSGEDEKDNSVFDIIVFVVGIILAIIIIILAIYLGARLLGINGLNLGTIHRTVVETETGDTEESIDSDKQVKVPDLFGMDQDGAEKILQENNLGIKIEEAYSEDYEKGLVIGQNPEKDKLIDKYSTVTVTISLGSQYVTVPDNLVGMTQVEAQDAIYDAGLYSKVEKQNSNDVAAGYVIGTDPEPGTQVSRSDIVTIYVSLGAETLYSTVPSLVNKTLEEAVALLEELNINCEVSSEESSSTIAEGRIISQDIEANTVVEQGSTVYVVVSTGQETVTVNNMVGKTKDAAVAYFEDLGLDVVIEEASSDTVAEGKVISQSISGGSTAAVGDEITLVISTGKETNRVPDVTGILASEAETQLKNAGFEVLIKEEYSTVQDVGYVIRQTPEGDTQKNKGTTVTIYVSKGAEPVSLLVSYSGSTEAGYVPTEEDFSIQVVYQNGVQKTVTATPTNWSFGTELTEDITITFTYTENDKTLSGGCTITVTQAADAPLSE